jgi:hypothetical protein
VPTKVYAPTEFFVPFLTIVIIKEAIHVYNLSIFHVKNSGKYICLFLFFIDDLSLSLLFLASSFMLHSYHRRRADELDRRKTY